MCTFIEDYLRDPAGAISAVRERVQSMNWLDRLDENQIYEDIASPEFHLYETVVMSDDKEITPRADEYAVVA